MNSDQPRMLRRDLIKLVGSASFFSLVPSQASAASMHTKAIPKGGERLAVVGLGTSRTFDVPATSKNIQQLAEVLQLFFMRGGQLIDTSPMYGRAEAMLGKTLPRLAQPVPLFTATKVWTDGKEAGITQMQQSAQRIGVPNIDLMQIHNLRDWKTHLATLRQWKEEGRIRYIGITTSHGRSHGQLIEILKKEPFDFVQFTYNIGDRSVEQTLLPLADEHGIATLINRPFQRGDLFRRVKGKPLPPWAKEIDCHSFGQFFLKFVIAHPAVTCVIPATSKPKHMRDNMAAGYGRLPDSAMRRKMAQYIASL